MASEGLTGTNAMVLEYLHSSGGDYDAHGAEATNTWLNSYAPARNWLMREGFVKDSGRKEVNERNRLCKVWELTEKGRAVLHENQS